MVILTNSHLPTTGIAHHQTNVEAEINGSNLGFGSLYITESLVTWTKTSEDTNNLGFSLEYPSISLHAISRDTSSYPKPCLYLQIDKDLDAEEKSGTESDEDEDDENETSDVRFIPDDATCLEIMYRAMSDCQALHPDAEDEDSEEEDELGAGGDYYGGGDVEEGIENLTEQGQATLARLEAMLAASEAQQASNGSSTDVPNGEAMDFGDGQGQFQDADME